MNGRWWRERERQREMRSVTTAAALVFISTFKPSLLSLSALLSLSPINN